MQVKRQTAPWDIYVEATIMEVVTMINDETKRKLRELNMQELVDALAFQQLEPATIKLKFDERMQ